MMKITIVTEIPDLKYGVYHFGSFQKIITAVFISDYAAIKFGKVFWPDTGFVLVDLETGKEDIFSPERLQKLIDLGVS